MRVLNSYPYIEDCGWQKVGIGLCLLLGWSLFASSWRAWSVNHTNLKNFNEQNFRMKAIQWIQRLHDLWFAAPDCTRWQAHHGQDLAGDLATLCLGGIPKHKDYIWHGWTIFFAIVYQSSVLFWRSPTMFHSCGTGKSSGPEKHERRTVWWSTANVEMLTWIPRLCPQCTPHPRTEEALPPKGGGCRKVIGFRMYKRIHKRSQSLSSFELFVPEPQIRCHHGWYVHSNVYIYIYYIYT